MIALFQANRFRQRLALLGAVLAGSVIWIGALHYAPAAHADLHHDATETDHHCVVEVFSDGVLIDTPDVSIHVPAERIGSEHELATPFHPEPASRLRPPGRAPPIG